MRIPSTLLVGILSLGLVEDAHACLRKKRPEALPKQATADQQLVSAEKALAKGEHARASQLARAAMPRLRELAPAEGAEVAFRAQRVAALAAIRAHGRIDLGDGLPGRDEVGRLTNLAWARLVLSYQAALRPDSVRVKVELAEALSESAADKDRALAILRDLADRDVMPTAHGYALLARLHADRGDASARDASLARCRDLGGSASCKV